MTTRGPRTDDAMAARLTGVITPVVGSAGYDLEELVVRPAGQRAVVRVVIDRDEGVDLDQVAELSRALSDVLDGDDAFGSSPYVLEVTSPGVDRQLTLPRHWRRNVGRLVELTAGSAGRTEQVTGRVVRVADDGVVLAVLKGGAKKGQVRREAGERTLAWAEVSEARVQVEFSRPPGHRDAALVHLGDDDEQDDEQFDEQDDEFEDGFVEQDDDVAGDPADAYVGADGDDAAADGQQATGPAAQAGARGGTGRPAPRRAPRGPAHRRGGDQ